MHDIHIHPAGVRTAAAGVHEVAGRMGPTADHWLDSSLTAGSDHPGWASSGALHDCATAWTVHMRAVMGQLQTYADQLDASASSYEDSDAEAARRMRQAHQDLAAGGR